MKKPSANRNYIEDDEPVTEKYIVVEFDADALAEADRLVTQAIGTYAECVAVNLWPGYPPGIHLASLPPWMLPGPQTLGDFVADSYLYDTDPLEES